MLSVYFKRITMKFLVAFFVCTVVAIEANVFTRSSQAVQQFVENQIPGLHGIIQKVKESGAEEFIKTSAKNTLCSNKKQLLMEILDLIKQDGVRELFFKHRDELAEMVVTIITQGLLTAAVPAGPIFLLAQKIAQFIVCERQENSSFFF